MDLSVQQTYLPDDERAGVRALRALISSEHGAAEGGGLTLTAHGEDTVVVPRQVQRILEQVVRALDDGLAVAVTPLARTLSTQQAADLLGVSRPTLVRLLDEGRMPFERAGTHRRVLLRDVMAYREERRTRQLAAIDATSVAIDEEGDLDDALALLREIRSRQGAARRGGGPVGGR